MNVRQTLTTRRVLLFLVAVFIAPAMAWADITTGLQVRYRLDETGGANAPDSSGNGRDGTLQDHAAFNTAGRIGGCVLLDGNGDYVSTPAVGPTDETDELTITFWIKTDEQGNNDAICGNTKDPSNLFIVHLGASGVNGTDDIAVAIHRAGANSYVYTEGNFIPNGVWVHVAVVYKGSEPTAADRCKIYINSKVVATTASSTPIPSLLHDDDNNIWYVGTRTDDTSSAVVGKLDEFHLFDRSLSAADVVDLYSQTAGSILFNGRLATANSKLQNTTADVLEDSTEVTICAWIHPHSAGESNVGVVAALDETGSGVVLRHNSGNALRLVDVRDATDGEWTFPITNNAWNAVAVTYDRVDPLNNPPRARVNSVDVTVTAQEAADGQPEPAGVGYCIGNLSNQSQTWDGRIAQVQVFNRMLTPAEMDTCLRTPGSVTRGLRLWLPMTSATDVNDRTNNAFHGIATALETANGPVIHSHQDIPPGIRFLPVGLNPVVQHIIPPYGNGSGHPAGQLRGWGPASVIQGTVYCPVPGGNPEPIVVTQDFPTTVNYWANGNLGGATPAIAQAQIRDCTIAGYDDLANGYGSGESIVNSEPGLWNPAVSFADREHGLHVQSAGALVDKVCIFHIAGTCLHLKSPSGLGSLNGPLLPFDREKTTVRDVWCLRAYRGVEIQQVDTVVGNITCKALRDWGIKFSAGAAQIDGPMHLFGVTSYPQATAGATPSPAVWFDTTTADRCWGGPWYVETSDIGMKVNSNGNVLGPIYSHTCLYGNIQVPGTYNTIRDFEINPITANNYLATGTAQGGTGSTIQLTSESTFVNDGLNGLRVVITSGTGAGQSRTITAYNGSTDTATVSPNWVTNPSSNSVYAIRQAPCIDVPFQENTIINGRIGPNGAVPDGAVAVRIGNGTRQTIRDLIIFGTTGSSAPLISVEGNGFVALKNSVIVAHCWNAGTFLDLYPTMARGIAQGSVGGMMPTIQLASSENFPDDYLNGAKIFITSGPGNGDERTITDYVGSTDTATVSSTWSTNPTSSSTYEVRVSRIGAGNYIWLTTDGTVTTPINFPPSWDSATNEIWVDGDRKP